MYLSTGILLLLYIKCGLLFISIVAGLILLPGNVVNLIMSPIVGALFDRFGARYFCIIGFLLMFISAITFAFMISDTTPVWAIILAFMILFLGISLVIDRKSTRLN